MKKNKKLELVEITSVKELKECNNAFGKFCKVYNDGKHFVAVRTTHHDKEISHKDKVFTDADRIFDELYFDAVKNNLKYGELRTYLINKMTETCNLNNADEFVERHLKSKLHNFYSRIKRFKRKANLNSWNYFCTFTFDSKKMDAETFKRKLKKCLSNLHCRRNWRYMGVFELSPTENRLHFHALMNIPNGEMIGTLFEKQDYSTKHHCMQTTIQNTFFNEKFGRSDFEKLTDADVKFGNALDYLTKYLHKSNDKIVYSRGIPTELSLFINNSDIATEYMDFLTKYVLFDDVFDSDLNYIPYVYTPPKQLSLFAT